MPRLTSTTRSFAWTALGLALALSLSAVVSCGGGGGGSNPPTNTTPAPIVSSFTPTSGTPGTSVTITGSHLTGATSVAFGGVAATAFTVNSDTQITVTVPVGALAGKITVTTPGGTINSSSNFTMNSSITSFTPSSGTPGTTVTINGSGLTSATSVTIGGVNAAYIVDTDAKISAIVPPEGTGLQTISVTLASGSATSSGSFGILPTVSAMPTTRGPAYTPFVLIGTGFTSTGTTVTIGGTSTSVTYQSSTQLTAIVPNTIGTGAKTVVLNTPGGSTNAPTSFTVTTGSTTKDLSIAGAYLTQSVQNLSRSVPLVKDRDGFMRVFVLSNQSNTDTPQARVRVKDGSTNAVLQEYVINAPGGSVPTVLDESFLSSSWNVAIPASVIQPGRYITVELDPSGTYPDADSTNNTLRIPASGNLSVTTLPTLNMVLVPVVVSNITPTLDDTNQDTYMAYTKAVHPIPSVYQLTLRGAYTTSTVLQCDGTGWGTVLGEVNALRNADHSTANYYGVLRDTHSGFCVRGIGYGGNPPVAIGWDSVSSAAETIAHELGHNFGYGHTRCYQEAGPFDDPYPYPDAAIGAYGYTSGFSTLSGTPVPQKVYDKDTYKNLMSYCHPYWLSDYSYTILFNNRKTSGVVSDGSGASDTTPSLMIWGRIENGQVLLEPAFVVDAVISVPEPGSYSTEVLDGNGKVLGRLSFEPTPIADLPESLQTDGFCINLPMDAALLNAVQGIRILRNGEVLALKQSSASTTAALTQGLSSPKAQRLKGGKIQVSWDSSVHPMAMIKDALTGKVLSFARNGSIQLDHDASQLEIHFSNGVRSERKTLNVVAP